jgi:hypothetical protein
MNPFAGTVNNILEQNCSRDDKSISFSLVVLINRWLITLCMTNNAFRSPSMSYYFIRMFMCYMNGSCILCYIIFDIRLFLFYRNGSCIMCYIIFVIMLFLFYKNGSYILWYIIFVIRLFLFYRNGSCILCYIIFVMMLFLFCRNGSW